MAPDTMGRFPRITASNLEGREFSLPGDFEGEANVVLVGFAREHQVPMDTWLPTLRSLAERTPALRVYELPVAPRSALAFRWLIDGGMRRGIPDRATRAVTITLYTNKAALREALLIPDESRIHVMLVGRDGHVRWRASGPFDRQAFAALEAALRETPAR